MAKRHLIAACVIAAVGAFGAYTYVKVESYERAFDSTAVGDSEEQVLARFGSPGTIELPSHPYLRYASGPCHGCARRLWWEHPILRGIEAWSIDIGADGRVTDTAHWVSP